MLVLRRKLILASIILYLFRNARTAKGRSFTIGRMNAILPPPIRSRTVSLLLYGLAVLMVLLAPILGILAAAAVAWQALLAGSIWYMPLGLVLVLAAIAMAYSHNLFDLAVLGLVIVAMIAWFTADGLQQGRLLEALLAMAPRTGLMAGLLLVMVLALVLIHAARRTSRW